MLGDVDASVRAAGQARDPAGGAAVVDGQRPPRQLDKVSSLIADVMLVSCTKNAEHACVLLRHASWLMLSSLDVAVLCVSVAGRACEPTLAPPVPTGIPLRLPMLFADGQV